jgi:DNA-binding protein Fis
MGEDSRLSRLESRFSPGTALADVFDELGGALDVQRVGVAVHVPDPDEFEVVALLDKDPAGGYTLQCNEPEHAAYRFAAAQTAGAWATAFGIPFVGNRPEDVAAHPRTFDYMLREQFASNCVVPLDTGRASDVRGGAMFLLARRPSAFDAGVLSFTMRIREVIEASLRGYLATRELRTGNTLADLDHEQVDVSGRAASLEQVERAHILRTLEITNWVIEGRRGAAVSLGLNPSTLRNRMRKLGIRRVSR